jgi:hypothetical protein
MIRQHEQAVFQLCLPSSFFSFVFGRIDYKIAFNVNKFFNIIHTNCTIIVTVQELRMFVMLL